jgi:hypothetical protein
MWLDNVSLVLNRQMKSDCIRFGAIEQSIS